MWATRQFLPLFGADPVSRYSKEEYQQAQHVQTTHDKRAYIFAIDGVIDIPRNEHGRDVGSKEY
jgi:hypothetical protein